MIYPDWNELDDGAEDPDIIKTLSGKDGAWEATTGIWGTVFFRQTPQGACEIEMWPCHFNPLETPPPNS